jgi:tRNA 2-thiouridine synthesizing protein E
LNEEKNLLDEEGFVKQTEFWTDTLAKRMAKEQFNILITDSHMEVIRFVREYYLKWGAIPMVKTIKDRFKLTDEQLDEMFKRGKSSSRGVICKLSGLPKMLCVASGC